MTPSTPSAQIVSSTYPMANRLPVTVPVPAIAPLKATTWVRAAPDRETRICRMGGHDAFHRYLSKGQERRGPVDRQLPGAHGALHPPTQHQAAQPNRKRFALPSHRIRSSFVLHSFCSDVPEDNREI